MVNSGTVLPLYNQFLHYTAAKIRNSERRKSRSIQTRDGEMESASW